MYNVSSTYMNGEPQLSAAPEGGQWMFLNLYMINKPWLRLAAGFLVALAKYVFLFWSLISLLFVTMSFWGISQGLVPSLGVWLGIGMFLFWAIMCFVIQKSADPAIQSLIKNSGARTVLEMVAFAAIGACCWLEWRIAPADSFFKEGPVSDAPTISIILLFGALVVMLVVLKSVKPCKSEAEKEQ